MMIYWMFKGSWGMLECCVALSSMSSNMSTFKGKGGICWMVTSCRVWNS